MKNITVIFWALILGQLVGYIGGSLTQGSYNFIQTTFVSLIAGLAVLAVGHVAPPKQTKK